MIEARRSAAWDRTVVRFSAFARALTGRRLAVAAIVAGLAIVWIVGVVQPGSSHAGDNVATGVGSDWGAGSSVAGLNVVDLVTKGALVLILLFVTLRILGRAQGNVAKKSSSRLVVLNPAPSPQRPLSTSWPSAAGGSSSASLRAEWFRSPSLTPPN